VDGCRVGLGRADLTPDEPGATAGWGPLGRTDARPPTEEAQRLLVTALALEDARGEHVVLVNADLHCGGLYLWRAAVEASGLDAARVVLCGTHTHAGPAQRYGGLMYTLGACPSPRAPWRSTRRLVPLVRSAVREALASLRPGAVAVVRRDVTGVASNRAVPAWAHYDDATRGDFLARSPLPDDATLPDRLRDPRVTALVARSDDGAVEAALAWYAVHGTSLGARWPHFGADLWGAARAEAERDGATVGFGGGSSGDVSPLPLDVDGGLRPPDDGRPSTQGRELADVVGHRLGSAVREALGAAEVAPFTVRTAHEMWEPRTSGLPAPLSGLATSGGGVDGPTALWPEVGAGVHAPRYLARRARARPPEDGQGPKIGIVHAYTGLPLPLGRLFRAVAPSTLPLHAVRVGDHVFATVPGEATTMTGARIEEAVLAAAGGGSASVIGFAGDYGGYWVTPEEYLEQRYEAASTIFGREASSALAARLAALTALAATRS
jgi:neutral ceramidase